MNLMVTMLFFSYGLHIVFEHKHWWGWGWIVIGLLGLLHEYLRAARSLR